MRLRNLDDTKKKHAQYSPARVHDLTGHPEIKGVDFEKPVSIQSLLEAFQTTGFQATQLAKAIHIGNKMREDKSFIFLAFTSNMITSGNRDIITYLCKHKKIDAIVTTAGGIEEDIIKCLKPFVLGDFHIPGKLLFDKGINRTGNIFVPNDRYAYFEKFIEPLLNSVHSIQVKQKIPFSTSELIKLLGDNIQNEESYLHWASKNKIPVFCPGITDGSLGDMIYFQKQRNKDFLLDITKDMQEIVSLCLAAEKTGAIILGSGIAKHFTLNANIFREGLDYAIYINTAEEFDGSDSGARPDEALTWGKIKPGAPAVKVHGDATILFPLLVAGTFAKETS